MKLTLLLLSLPVVLFGCTSKQLYEHTQSQVEADCRTKVGVEREQCFKNVNTKTYKEYEAERKEIIKDK